MKQFVPVEKMSKKARGELYRTRRGGWGGLSPVTRRPENPKAYHRKRVRREDHTFEAEPFPFFAGRVRPLQKSRVDSGASYKV